MKIVRELIVYKNANTIEEINPCDHSKVFVRYFEELGSEHDEALIDGAKECFDGIDGKAIMVIRIYEIDDTSMEYMPNWGIGPIVSTNYEVLASK